MKYFSLLFTISNNLEEPKSSSSSGATPKDQKPKQSQSHNDEQRSKNKYKKRRATAEELEKILSQNLGLKQITLPVKLPAILKTINRVNNNLSKI